MATSIICMSSEKLSQLDIITYNDSLVDIYDLGIYKPVIDGLRKDCYGSSAALSSELAGWILDSGDLASSITFIKRNNYIKVMNDFTGNVEEYPSHSVVLYGEIIVDALCSDKVFRTKDYIERLEKLNGSVEISMTGSSWVSGDSVIIPNINSLKYKYDY